MTETLICPVIVHYKSPDTCIRLLQSLQKSVGVRVHPIVVDNGSDQDAYTRLKQNMPFGEVISSKINLGYAGGLNLGLRRAIELKPDFVWCLTHDLTVEPDAAQKLAALWPELNSPGLLGALTDFNSSDEIYFYRGEITNAGKTRHLHEGYPISSIPELKKRFGLTDYVNGASIFTTPRVIDKIGFMPEDYFLYFEDTEWSLIAAQKGVRNYVSYEARLHHHRPKNEMINWTAEYYCRRNAYFFKQRNGFQKAFAKPRELLRLNVRMIKSYLNGNKDMALLLREVARDISDEHLGKRRGRHA